jgi:quercetin dioxygenase-like cupin family protein
MTDINELSAAEVYPDLITSLPEVEVPLQGVKGWLMSGSGRQMVFFMIEPTAVVPEHSHCAQWGMVIEGEMSLTIGGETKTYTKGDRYFIGEGVAHGAKFHSRVFVLDMFDSTDRYQAKE